MPVKNKKIIKHDEKNHSEDETLIQWEAPGRPFKKRTSQFYLTALLLMLLVETILFLFSEYLLMFVVVALLFVTFALASVPPKQFVYRISNEGFQIEDKFFLWQELYDFYFLKREGQETLHIRTEAFFPGELVITFDVKDKDVIKKVLISFLPYREFVKLTFMERAADWLGKNFPLEG